MLYSLSLFPRPFVWSCDQVKQSHRMAIVFLDCQRGSLRLTQMMSLDVKMLEKKLFTVWSQTYELRKEPFWGWYKKLPAYTILHAIYLLWVSTLGPPLDQQEIVRFPDPLTSGLSSQLGTQRAWSAFPTLSPPEFIWVPLNISDTESVAKVVFLGLISPRLDLLLAKVDIPCNLNSEAVLQRNG